MRISDYIKKKIDELASILSNVSFSVNYAYEKPTDFHIVEIQPESVRRGNDDYMEWEYSFWKEFSELFPDKDLIISEPDKRDDMSNLIYSYSSLGIDFKNENIFQKPIFKTDFSLSNKLTTYAIAA